MNIEMNQNLKKHLKDLNSNMTKVIDSDKYIEFVKQTTSKPSSNLADLLARIAELESVNDCNVPHLLTGALGLSAEAGEFVEIVKKILLQGKSYTEENVIHMKKEAGDCLWYISQICIALDTNFEELMQMNYEKLSARYPEGTFDVWRSENRVEGDL
jgi:NTP pyrophosphatase (non-canonical NTP hydrolase)